MSMSYTTKLDGAEVPVYSAGKVVMTFRAKKTGPNTWEGSTTANGMTIQFKTTLSADGKVLTSESMNGPTKMHSVFHRVHSTSTFAHDVGRALVRSQVDESCVLYEPELLDAEHEVVVVEVRPVCARSGSGPRGVAGVDGAHRLQAGTGRKHRVERRECV